MMDTVCYLEIIKTYIYIYQNVTVYEKMYTDQNMIEPKCKNFQKEIFCRSREIFVEAGSFDNYKPPTIML